jgi:hypothetical protein
MLTAVIAEREYYTDLKHRQYTEWSTKVIANVVASTIPWGEGSEHARTKFQQKLEEASLATPAEIKFKKENVSNLDMHNAQDFKDLATLFGGGSIPEGGSAGQFAMPTNPDGSPLPLDELPQGPDEIWDPMKMDIDSLPDGPPEL